MSYIENNKLIAEFIGRCGKNDGSLYTFPGVSELLSNNEIWYELKDSKFHTSWDWLMPVLEKIETLNDLGKDVNISTYIIYNKTYINVTHYNIGGIKSILINKEETKFLNTYVACVEFIKWYNNEKLNNNFPYIF